VENSLPAAEPDQSSVADLLSFRLNPISEVMGNWKPANFLIKHYLPSDSITCIFAPPGVGKTFMALDIGCHIAAGKDWHGHKIRKPKAVILIAGEGHSGLPTRFLAWATHNKLELDADIPFYISGCAAQFSEIESAAEASTEVHRIMSEYNLDIGLIIVDTWSRNFGPGNESEARDTNQVITNIDLYLRKRFSTSVLIVHHTGHSNQDRARGSSVFDAALDCSYKLEKVSDDQIRLTNTKMKDAEPPAPLTFEMNPIELEWCDDEGVPLSSIALTLTDSSPHNESKGLGRNQQAMLDLLRNMHQDMRDSLPDGASDNTLIEVRQWREHAIDMNVLTGKYVRQDFQKIKSSLSGRGLIRIEGVYVYVEV